MLCPRPIWWAGIVSLALLVRSVPAAPAEVSVSVPVITAGDLWLLDSDPAHDALHLNVLFDVNRNQPAGAARQIPLRVSIRLVEMSGGSASVGSVTHTERISVPPVAVNLQVSLDLEITPIEPLSQDKTYGFRLTLSHDDDPPSDDFVVDHSVSDGPHGIVHFSGQLAFGAHDTVMNGFSAPPVALGGSNWRLTISEGELSTGIPYEHGVPSTPTIDVQRDDATGDASVVAGSVRITPPQNPITVNDWSVRLGRVLMDADGIAAGSFSLVLPEGAGWRLDDTLPGTPQTLNPLFSSEGIPLILGADLQPVVQPAGTFAVPHEFVDERMAAGFAGSGWGWDFETLRITQPAARFQREWHYEQWKTVKGDLPDSNDGYLDQLEPAAAGDLLITPGLQGGFEVGLNLGPGTFSTHFPHGFVAHAGGTLDLAGSMPDPETSVLSVATAWVLTYIGCRVPGDPHGLPDAATREAVQVGPAPMRFTAHGSLWSEGAPRADADPDDDLVIVRRAAAGLDGNGEPVHETADYLAQDVQILVPSPVAPAADGLDHSGDDNSTVDDAGEQPNEFNPARWLYTGLRPEEDALEHPGTAGYLAGTADYAGVNFRYFPGLTGISRVGGGEMGPYSLEPCQKLYARASGVSGLWVADQDSLPPSVQVGGPEPFTLNLDTWAFQILGNEPHFENSAVAGSVSLPYPANFTLDFDSIEFTCCGNLDKLGLDGEAVRTLSYWDDARIAIQSARFVSADECSMEDSCLELHVRARANGLPDEVDGILGFRGTGRMTTGLDEPLPASALHLDAASAFAGNYYITPVRHAYYNDPGNIPPPTPIVPGDGFISVAGLLDLPFFQAMESHAVLNGRELPDGANANIIRGLQGGWEQDGKTYFTHADFDEAHRGLPPAFTSANPYVLSHDEAYLPQARRTWFGLIPFSFPVVYDAPTRYFHSVEKSEVDVIIAQAEADVPRLNHEQAAIDFGVTLGLSLNNLFAEALSFVTGEIVDGFGDLTDTVLAPVSEGLHELDQLLSLQARDALGASIMPVLEGGIIEQAAAQLKNGAGVNDALDQLAFAGNLQNQLASEVSGYVDDKLSPIALGLNNFTAFLDADAQEELLGPFMVDLMDSFNLPPGFETLSVIELIELAGLENGPLRERLDELRARMQELRDLVQNVTGLTGELEGLLGGGAAGFGDLQNEVRSSLEDYFEMVDLDPSAYSLAEIENRIRAEIEARLWAMPVMSEVQAVLRFRFYHLDHLIKQVFASALEQLNRELSRIVAEVVDVEELLGELDGFGAYVNTASLKGQAVITGDDLTYLSLKAHTVIQTQPIPLNFDPFYEFQQLHSDGAHGCDESATPVLVNRITMGATVSPATFTYGEINVSVSTQFSFTEDGRVIGFMGGFETLQEGLQMQPVNFDRINVLLSIGGNDPSFDNFEFYIAGEGHATLFGSPSPVQLPYTNFKLHGGLFAGRTCTSLPYSAWAPEDMLPEPPPALIGAIVSVDGKFPFYDVGCLLRLKAGASVGAWVLFSQGPEIGTFLRGSVSGDFLCLISGDGSIELAGTAGENHASFHGSIEASLKAGPCPFCLKFNPSLTVDLDTETGVSVAF